MYFETPRDIHKNFWSYARVIDESMKEFLSSERILLQEAFSSFYSDEMPQLDEKQPISDYLTSNMGDITRMVIEVGHIVRVTNLLRGTVFPTYVSLLNVHTFRGILGIMMDYKPSMIQKDFVEKLDSQIEECLLEVTEL